MRVLLATFVLFVFALGTPQDSEACSCKPQSRGAQVDSHKLVFYGEVSEGKDGELEVKVVKSWKGTKKGRKFKVGASESMCDLELSAGKSYMIYANPDKKTIRPSICSGTSELDYVPYSPVAWGIGEDHQYGMTKREKAAQEKARTNLTNAVSKTFKSSLQSCHKKFWTNSKEPRSGHVELRLRFESKKPEVEISKFETSVEVADEVKECLIEKMEKGKYPKHQGAPVTVRVYRILDALDSVMKRDRTDAVIEDGPRVEELD